jgi:hypothetical protein
MVKKSLVIKDLHNTCLLTKLIAVVEIFKELSLETGCGVDTLVLEDFGTTLVQNAWTDDTGWFITYRLHPLYSHLARVVEASLTAQKRLCCAFYSNKMTVECIDDKDRDTRITVFISANSYSIGD